MGTLILFTPLLGLLSGILIAHLAPAEVNHGRQYLLWLQYGIITLIISIILYRAVTGSTTTLQHLVIPFFLLFITTGSLYYKQHKKLAIIETTYIIIAVLSAFLF